MENETEKMKFSELTLSEEMQRAIAEVGYEEASPIQAAGIPVLLAGRDVIGPGAVPECQRPGWGMLLRSQLR